MFLQSIQQINLLKYIFLRTNRDRVTDLINGEIPHCVIAPRKGNLIKLTHCISSVHSHTGLIKSGSCLIYFSSRTSYSNFIPTSNMLGCRQHYITLYFVHFGCKSSSKERNRIVCGFMMLVPDYVGSYLHGKDTDDMMWIIFCSTNSDQHLHDVI